MAHGQAAARSAACAWLRGAHDGDPAKAAVELVVGGFPFRAHTAQIWARNPRGSDIEACSLTPCQGFSKLGKREGYEHEGSGLFRQIVRLLGAEELGRPALVFLENVPQILGLGMEVLAATLAAGCRPMEAEGGPCENCSIRKQTVNLLGRQPGWWARSLRTTSIGLWCRLSAWVRYTSVGGGSA